MDKIKRILGLLWMILGPITIAVLITSAVQNISAGGTADIHKPLPWLIIIGIFTPIAIGLTIFGWYAWKGAYDGEIKT
ncbi:DUF6814 family protein [Flavisolibacter ginsengisoli]|jgi:type VI protein secretion system component VasK|uniref:Uncharacterized protein n=1 Tax=Flavisolibacter ginsengisoli DSM 18119 TaxID=1121884 RepID=A0A1M5G3P4_9BACT|nr:hypothetical protein [Flavisolibacter ginsengisoli]SHF98343.1 hypothetical protein SAMN02745131_04041 [Flavisolibacter ginsengisoli DSM 18119]